MNLKLNKISYFILSGIASNVSNVAVFYIFVNFLKVSMFASGSFAYFVGLFIGFYLNSNYTFKVKKKFKSKFITYLSIQIIIYLFYSIFNLIVMSSFIAYNLLLHIIGIGICALLNFTMLNFYWGMNENR